MGKNEKAPIPIDGDRKAEEERAKRIQGLITGNIDPPNDYVSFIIERLRSTRMEKDMVVFRLDQGRSAVKALEDKLIELKAIHNNYMDDLEKWDEPKGGDSK